MDLKAWRKAHGYTQDQAAAMAGGMAQTTWSRIERGRPVAEVYRLAAERLVNSHASQQDASLAPEMMIELPENPITSPEPSETSAIAFDMAALRTEQIDGAVWLNLTDVCQAIDYSDPQNALRLIETEDQQKLRSVSQSGRIADVWFISEAGLYQFLLSSNVPKAKPFKKWVTTEVLPKLHRTGSYSMMPAASAGPGLEDLARLVGLRTAQLETAIQHQRAEIAEVKETIQQIESRAVTAAHAEWQRQQMAEAEARQRVGSKRHYIEKMVRHLGQMIADKTPALPDAKAERARRSALFKNVWGSVHLHAYVSKFDDIVSEDQCDRAMACLNQVANTHGIILPAYQPTLPGVMAV